MTGFFVLAPRLELRQRACCGINLESLVNVASVQSAISDRIALYGAAGRMEVYRELRDWEAEWCAPILSRLGEDGTIAVLAWEDVIDTIHANDPEVGEPLRRFYHRCLREAQLQVQER